MNLIIKGFVVGIGKILPGVSGSMIAITLGIYEKTIKILSEPTKINKEKAKYIMKIGIGIVLSIILMSKIIVKCLKRYYLPTILLFTGIIIGELQQTIKQTKLKKTEIISLLTIITTITVLINHITIKIINNHEIKYTIIEFTKIIIIGIIDAITSIVPGISGTAILMTLGYYNTIIETFSTLTNPHIIIKNIFILLPFAIGFIIGTIETSKLITKLIEKHSKLMNKIVIILMTTTIIVLIKNTTTISATINQKIVGIILLTIGIILNKSADEKK